METDVQTVAVSPDGRHLVTFETRDGWLEVVGLWELSTGKLVARIARRFQPGMHSPEFPYLRAAGFANTGDVQVIGTLGGKLMAWTFTITQAAARAAQNVAKPISEAERSSLLSLDEVATATEIAPLHQGEYTAGIALFPSGSYLAHIVSATDRSNLRLYSRSTGRCVFELPEHPRPDGIFRTAVHPLGKLIAYVGVHGGKEIVDVWDIVAGRRLRRLTDFKGPVDSLAFSPDGKALATGSAKEIFFDPENMYDRRPRITQGAIVLWELATGLPRRSFPAHSAAICSLAFSSDGQRLVSGCADSTLLVWDVASPR
jgi:WD40 repeat protein